MVQLHEELVVSVIREREREREAGLGPGPPSKNTVQVQFVLPILSLEHV